MSANSLTFHQCHNIFQATNAGARQHTGVVRGAISGIKQGVQPVIRHVPELNPADRRQRHLTEAEDGRHEVPHKSARGRFHRAHGGW